MAINTDTSMTDNNSPLFNPQAIPIQSQYTTDYIETLIDTIHNNHLNAFYSKENTLFKERIDKLNLKFYLESEKYLSNKTSQGKCQDSLFIILFQQIGLYIEEIERLNSLVLYNSANRKIDSNVIKERMEESISRQKEFEIKEKLIQTLKETNKKLELQLCALITNEDKLKLEVERLKRQNVFYRDKLKIYLLNKYNDVKINNCNCNDNDNGNDILAIDCNKALNESQNPSVLNMKKCFVRKRNNSDLNTTNIVITANANANGNGNAIGGNQQKKSKIIKRLKENNTEVRRNGFRCPLIGNKDDSIRNYDMQLNELSKMESFLNDMKQELFTSKGTGDNGDGDGDVNGNGMPINCFDSQEYSDINLKTEVISDIEDYEGGGYYKNSTVATTNSKEVKVPLNKTHNTKSIGKKTIKPNGFNSIPNNANANTNTTAYRSNKSSHHKQVNRIGYSTTNSKSKTTCKIKGNSNTNANTNVNPTGKRGGLKKYSSKY